MNKEFVNYDIALELKELGFDEPCFGFYTYKGEIRRYTNFDEELNDFQTLKNSSITMGRGWCTAPLYQQCWRWFREKYKLEGLILPQNQGAVIDEEPIYFITIISYKNNKMEELFNSTNKETLLHYNPKEEAELACINKLIEIVKNK